ncbi:MAG: DNA-binding response regulator [Chloroflexi bacterium]|nr:MAG: DNA-binding response regulator [Chloroflexota bacterium]
MSQTILIVDDEPTILEILSLYLRRDGYKTLQALDGEEALALARSHHPDLLILDIMLPKRSGLEVASKLRHEYPVPIIFLSARGDEADRITGLELGGDDYVVKPFSPREVVARVRAVLRRSPSAQGADDAREVVVGDLRIRPAERSVTVASREVDLTAKEFDLLLFLAKHPRQVFPRDRLLDRVWGFEAVVDESTVTVHIRRLREKIEVDPSHPKRVVTVWGVGYKLEVG